MKLLTSGDIELNPGPQQGVNCQTTLSVGSTMLLNFWLHQLGLRPQDVGGWGDCFFRAVSHQLYGDPSHHWYVRQAGIHYLRENPEHFIESNTQNSWNEYLTNMSRQGSWCDALIVQAVAESQNLRIHIVESHENFAHPTSQNKMFSLKNHITVQIRNVMLTWVNIGKRRRCQMKIFLVLNVGLKYKFQNTEKKVDKICAKGNRNAYMSEKEGWWSKCKKPSRMLTWRSIGKKKGRWK